MSLQDLASMYAERYEAGLVPLERVLQEHLAEVVRDCPRIDRVVVRAKTPESFLGKAERKEGSRPKYTDPLRQIQDQVGARVVAFYLSDVAAIGKRVEDYFAPIEGKQIVPDSPSKFGYEGKHYVLFVPEDVKDGLPEQHLPKFFELQIKTLFQHAWAEANHDLEYKGEDELSTIERRKVAFTAAQAWGADRLFEELATRPGAGLGARH